MRIGRNHFVKDKKIIVTGASKGIGRGIAIEIAAHGGIPILIARSQELLQELADEIEANNGICRVYPIDRFSREAIEEQINDMLETEKRIHGLINNAGFGVFDSIEELNMDEVEEMFQVNVLAGMQYAKAFLPHFLQFKGNRILLILFLRLQNCQHQKQQDMLRLNMRCWALQMYSDKRQGEAA